MSSPTDVPSKSDDETDVLDDVPPESPDDEGWTGLTYGQPNPDDEYEQHLYDLLENRASRQVLRRALAVIRYIEIDRRLPPERRDRISMADYSFSDRTETGNDLIEYIIGLKPRFQRELADLQAAYAALMDSDSDSDASTVVDGEEEEGSRIRPREYDGECKGPPTKTRRTHVVSSENSLRF